MLGFIGCWGAGLVLALYLIDRGVNRGFMELIRRLDNVKNRLFSLECDTERANDDIDHVRSITLERLQESVDAIKKIVEQENNLFKVVRNKLEIMAAEDQLAKECAANEDMVETPLIMPVHSAEDTTDILPVPYFSLVTLTEGKLYCMTFEHVKAYNIIDSLGLLPAGFDLVTWLKYAQLGDSLAMPGAIVYAVNSAPEDIQQDLQPIEQESRTLTN